MTTTRRARWSGGLIAREIKYRLETIKVQGRDAYLVPGRG